MKDEREEQEKSLIKNSNEGNEIKERPQMYICSL